MSRITMSAAQFALFQKPAKLSGLPAVRRKKEDLPENQLERQILDFLRVRNWQNIRQQVGTYAPYRVLMALSEGKMTVEQARRNIVRIGEKGAADWLAMRPRANGGKILHDVFFWECKAPGKKPKPEQLAWLNAREATGTMAKWFDTFNDGYGEFSDCFVSWYRATFETQVGR